MNQSLPRILCVDDEPQNISLLQAMLMPRGYEVVTAINGQDALFKIRHERIDLCLLDVMMLGMDGYEVCRQIKSEDLHRKIPVVMITSLADKENRIRGIEAGAEDFISKPFDSTEVLARVKMLLHVKSLNDKLESANLELEAFNYSVAHDLRSPLIVIHGFLELLKKRSSDTLDEQCKGYLQRVMESAQSMNRLIDTLLSFSHINRVVMQRERFDLSRIANEVSMSLHDSAPERLITFSIAEGLMVEGDPELLRVVLNNLMGNAWKHNCGQESVVIEFGVTEAKGITIYFVRDNGQGFDMSLADKLFIPFLRLPGTNVEGHGIGLATAERIVTRHGGRIWAESMPGKGATFLFTLR